MVCDLKGKDVLVWLCRKADPCLLDIEAHRRGERNESGRTFDENIKKVFHAVDVYACGQILLVCEKGSRYAAFIKGEYESSSPSHRAACEIVSEEGLTSLLSAAERTAVYTVPDSEGTLPPSLDRIPKYWFDYEGMRPWPAGQSLGELCMQSMAPAEWTQHFLPGTYDLAAQLERVRTILRHKGEAGVPQYVLITGETGTGKSFFTRNLPRICDDAYNNPRKKFEEPSLDERIAKSYGYLQGNCASLSPELADALLFGAVTGAYTGCNVNKDGLIEGAGDGILFLDEVGDLPLATQGKLLTALEEKVYYRLGDTGSKAEPRQVRCSIIFGTNRDLAADAQEWEDTHGRSGFRKDLLFRINSCHVELPPLRTRLSGKSPQAQALLNEIVKRSCENVGMALTDGAREVFDTFAYRHPWPGNFRDVRHLFEDLKLKSLEDGTGMTVSAHMMKTAVKRLSGAQAEDDDRAAGSGKRETPLIDKVKAQFTSPCEANEIDFIFRVCQDARSCADAGRAFYGTGKNRNYPDVFKKRLAHFGLAFDKSAPGHLSLRPAASQAK